MYGVCYCLSNSYAIAFRHNRRFNYQPQFQDRQKPRSLISRRAVRRRYYRPRIKSQKTTWSVNKLTNSFNFSFSELWNITDSDVNNHGDGLTLRTSNYFFQTPVGARLIFSMLLLGAKLIFANLPPGAELFFEPGNVATLASSNAVTK